MRGKRRRVSAVAAHARCHALPTAHTRTGKPISPNNVLRRWVAPACVALGLRNATWLTFRRTFSSWSHEESVPSKGTAELMGHSKVDMTLNTYTQVMPDAQQAAVRRVSPKLFDIVHSPAGRSARNSLKILAPQVGLEPTTLRLTG